MFTRFMPLAVLAVGLSTGAAQAATYYTEFTAWNADATGVPHYEDFSTPLASAQVLAINGDLTSTANSDPAAGSTFSYQRVNGGEFQQAWGAGAGNRYDSFTWVFAEPITGFFVTLIDFEVVFSMAFDEGTGNESFDVSNYTGGSGGFGVIFDQAISSVTFSTTWGYDISAMNDLYYKTASSVSTVPVPAGLPLLVSGLGGLGLMGWRRKRAAAA